MGNDMVKEFVHLLMEATMRVILQKASSMDMVNSSGVMVDFTWEIGVEEKSMGWEWKFGQMARYGTTALGGKGFLFGNHSHPAGSRKVSRAKLVVSRYHLQWPDEISSKLSHGPCGGGNSNE